MFSRSVTEGGPNHGTAANAVSRADMAISGAKGVVELPDYAIAASSSARALPSDSHGLGGSSIEFGRIRAAADAFYKSKEEIEAIEKLREKLTLGYATIQAIDLIPADVEEAVSEVKIRTDLILGGAKPTEDRELASRTNRARDKIRPVDDKKRVLSEIEAALERIGLVKDKLQQGEDDGYNQLLSLNALVSGLNSARTQVDDSSYSLSAASATVETIMVNMRTAVVAHGATSADIVRLVLTS